MKFKVGDVVVLKENTTKHPAGTSFIVTRIQENLSPENLPGLAVGNTGISYYERRFFQPDELTEFDRLIYEC